MLDYKEAGIRIVLCRKMGMADQVKDRMFTLCKDIVMPERF